jgi:hypothetical protein
MESLQTLLQEMNYIEQLNETLNARLQAEIQAHR